MFALAERHLTLRPSLGSAVAQRFPFVLIDEMQDTSALQQNLLDRVFDHPSTTVQRVGDVNQRIFTDRSVETSSFPRAGFIELPVSRRFGRDIAEVASSLTVHRSQRIRGAGPTGAIIVLLYDERSVTKVVPAFERIAVDVVPQELLQNHPPQVLAARKRRGTADDFPQSLACYVPEFAANTPDDARASLLLTVRSAQQQWRSGASRAAVERLWDAIRTIYTEEKLSTLRSLDRNPGSSATQMRALLLEILTEPIDDEDKWRSLTHRMTRTVSALTGSDAPHGSTHDERLRYIAPPAGTFPKACKQLDVVRSEFNTIQSAKGETHSATLILECLDRRGKTYDVREVLKLLHTGGNLSAASPTVRRIAQLFFVGATRPTRLLALAVHRNHASPYLDMFESRGWTVHDLTLDRT